MLMSTSSESMKKNQLVPPERKKGKVKRGSSVGQRSYRGAVPPNSARAKLPLTIRAEVTTLRLKTSCRCDRRPIVL
jgi:hypothetical protein